MSLPSRRAVITGSAALTPIGNDPAAIWQALVDGRSGVATIQSFDASQLPCRFAGEVRNFVAKQHFSNKDPKEKEAGKGLRKMARAIQLGLVTSKLTMANAQLERGQLDATRFGVEMGAAMMAIELPDLVAAAKISSNGQPGQVSLADWGAKGIDTIEPTWMLKYLPNMPACHITILHDAQGPSNTHTGGDISGLQALGEAFRIIQRSQADFLLAGAADSKLEPIVQARHNLFFPFTRRREEPERSVRPFDRDRDGNVLAEGSALFAVEELEHAQKRGAAIQAEVVGFGAAVDVQRNGSGLARAMRAALREAGISPADVDHVNAHGLATRETDLWEARGLREVFGPNDPPVFAGKGFVGHCSAAAGAVELYFSLLALQKAALPGSINCDHPDPECRVHVHTGVPRALRTPYVLKLSFTDLGQCAAIVLRRWE
ncbi:MAG TPA: beta-ketoacyl-[acyl-carrier-protein] synthase family protein [Gemmataceae bacterium]|nr:beta-ketoacyl-[acyl-carrier-protein] synthase family protein [Gemmataceae bacterium]